MTEPYGFNLVHWIVLVVLAWSLFGSLTAMALLDGESLSRTNREKEAWAAGLLFWPLLWLKGLGLLVIFLVSHLAYAVSIGWKRVWR